MDDDVEIVLVAVRCDGKFRWFRSDREWWVLDTDKWRDEFIRHGHDVPEFDSSYRFGIRVVDHESMDRFFENISKFEVSKQELGLELGARFHDANSWWDVQDLFPIMIVDFDRKRVGAFYYQGIPMERYVPEGWVGEFVDFATEYDEEVFPVAEKFWIQTGKDLLALLNARAAKENHGDPEVE